MRQALCRPYDRSNSRADSCLSLLRLPLRLSCENVAHLGMLSKRKLDRTLKFLRKGEYAAGDHED